MMKMNELLTPVLKGFSKLNFAGDMYMSNNITVYIGNQRDDSEAIGSDWSIVGKTIRSSMREFDHE